ncbi:hypothetical protein [Ligilactobacillus acidipiscis]|uniref:Phage protein n=1 Tax=Ligilactobacillus acidipiscis TaxID=89059 RepID=A0A1K1KQF2_9LACO|nr:hypothetical protein [Ligilactobacillus acidipiscis]SFV41066.1 FIG00752114: hypothetical protein [Ligilactobacillus acidipiscis]
MSAMNDLDLRLKEFDKNCKRMEEAAAEGHKLVQAIRQSLTDNGKCEPADNHLKRDPIQDKVTIRQLLAKKCQEGYTAQVKDLLHKFGAEKLSDVDPKDYEDLYYSAEGSGQ